MTEREGAEVRSGWGRREFVPWDEVKGSDGVVIELHSGRRLKLPPAAREAAQRALPVDAPSDIQAWRSYVGGDWSPVRACKALLSIVSALGASDVHLEAVPGAHHLRARVAGEPQDLVSVDSDTGRRLIAAFKHLSGCMPYRSDLVQEGQIPRDGVAGDVRASFLPTALGERAALRLFGRLLALDQLGLPGSARLGFEAALRARSGLVLVAGPSGGGKTTTLYAALAHVARSRGGAHLSLEDPVEQRLRVAGVPVDQVELRPERGLTAEVALVGALRQDVDVLAIGEIRTSADACLALQAAHTGRLVLAGVHAGSAVEAVQRMRDLGVDPTVLRATLQAVLHQRLVTVTCAPCTGAGCVCRGLGRVRIPEVELHIPEAT